MLTLATMKTMVSRRIQKTDADFLTKIEDWLNHRYDTILRRYGWPQLVKTKSVTSTADAETLVLGKDVGVILEIHDRTNDVVLQPVGDAVEGARLYADVQNSSGVPKAYWREEDTVAAQPTSASVLAVSSASASDTTQKVRIWGIAGGEEVTETVTLTGTTPVNSTNSYTRVDRISKDGNTAGVITLTANSAAVTVATIAPTEVAPRYTKIHLVMRPESALTYHVSYKVKHQRLVNAEDVPLIPCHEAMVRGAYADALMEQKQFEKAALEEQNFENLLETLLAETDRQEPRIPRFIPHVELSPIDESI